MTAGHSEESPRRETHEGELMRGSSADCKGRNSASGHSEEHFEGILTKNLFPSIMKITESFGFHRSLRFEVSRRMTIINTTKSGKPAPDSNTDRFFLCFPPLNASE
jgi:hypothetical protein